MANVEAQQLTNADSIRDKMQWFSDAKLGIFIHWGVYAVPSYAPVIENSGYSYAEWYWYRLHEQQKEFKAFHAIRFSFNSSNFQITIVNYFNLLIFKVFFLF